MLINNEIHSFMFVNTENSLPVLNMTFMLKKPLNSAFTDMNLAHDLKVMTQQYSATQKSPSL